MAQNMYIAASMRKQDRLYREEIIALFLAVGGLKYFGNQSWADVCTISSGRVDIPVGQSCAYCIELITAEENGMEVLGFPVHGECFLRAFIVGPVAHVLGQCACYGGHQQGDPEGMTKREAAVAAVEAKRQLLGREVELRHVEDTPDA